jgi:hypothetical protein
MLPDNGMRPTDRQDTGRAGQERPEQPPLALDWWPVLRSVPPSMTAELARLRAAFPAFSVSIGPGWRGPTFEAWRDPAAGGLYAVITQDAGELWRELGECQQGTSTDVASATGARDREGARRDIQEDAMTVEDPHCEPGAGNGPAQVAPDRWQAASYRCSCGFARDDKDEFDRHLDDIGNANPEHFEVLNGWTLPQVRQWQATAGPHMTSSPAGTS